MVSTECRPFISTGIFCSMALDQKLFLSSFLLDMLLYCNALGLEYSALLRKYSRFVPLGQCQNQYYDFENEFLLLGLFIKYVSFNKYEYPSSKGKATG